MIISNRDSQKIVDRLIKILGKNINIMDTEGIIIGSGDKDRINTFHEVAKIAAVNMEEVIVTKEDAKKYKGCRIGVNLPLYHNGQVVGVVGITGEPKDVKGYGLIVKELVELMIQENERQKIELFQSRAKRSFAKELIKKHDNMDLSLLEHRAKLVDFSLDKERNVIVMSINNFQQYIIHNDLNEIMIQELKEKITGIISNVLDSDDIIFNLKEQVFILLKSKEENLYNYCDNICKSILEQLGVNMCVGIGSLCKNVEEYAKSYLLSCRVMEIGKRIDKAKNIYFLQDYKLQLLLQNIKIEDKNEFLNGLDEIILDKKNNEIVNTIKVYFENGMNINCTSKSLYVHRNTVIYRLNKAKEIFNMEINKPYECMLIYLAINLLL
ncbi:CdaR family transcriptional regulator [Clostridium lundense]|uniref:CdaR family transcriptional regulator n=1 Tax=Clostridium lundense TaxID=319475 RepID=UPI000688BAC6|nr:sugar diacid recognition domain-containing protein [Clostridium lundense]